MSGKLVISLDFELMWGVRDKRTISDYGDAVLNVRQVVPELLDRFAGLGIRATWATVGFLFCKSRDEMIDHAPSIRPAYTNLRLSPYAALESEVGRNEDEDPYHFGRSLIDRIKDTEGQEIATHTYSHFCSLEDGHSCEAFEADLEAAKSVALESGISLKSIVFPRNQYAPEHLEVCRRLDLSAFRGNPDNFAYKPRKDAEITLAVRGLRLADAVLPATPRASFEFHPDGAPITNIRASRFLRPFMTRAQSFSEMHLVRIKREMRVAARRGEVYHLWWHPHNMGRDLRRNLAQLDSVLHEFRELQDSHGFRSVSMSDLSFEILKIQGQRV